MKKKGVQFYFILGLFVAAFAGGIFCCVQFYNSETALFCLAVVWTVFYGFAMWCWFDKDRLSRFEAIMTPVIFGSVFLLLIAFLVAGLWIFIPKIASGEKVPENILVLILAEGSLIMFAVIFYKYYLREPFQKLTAKIRKSENKPENLKP